MEEATVRTPAGHAYVRHVSETLLGRTDMKKGIKKAFKDIALSMLVFDQELQGALKRISLLEKNMLEQDRRNKEEEIPVAAEVSQVELSDTDLCWRTELRFDDDSTVRLAEYGTHIEAYEYASHKAKELGVPLFDTSYEKPVD
jgi:hypothetical protein